MIKVYQANKKASEGLFFTLKKILVNTIESRDLILQLFRRDFLMQYRKSFLGMGWLILSPLIGVLSWIIMNRSGILQPGDVGVPYPVFVLLGSMFWGLFMNTFTATSQTLSTAKGFILQVNYPHEVLVFKQVLVELANFAIVFVINLLVVLLFDVTPTLGVVLAPLVLIPMLLMSTSIGLVTSLFTVVASDIHKVLTTILNLIFYLTPVIYDGGSTDGILADLIRLNPLSYFISAARDLTLYGSYDQWQPFLIASVLSLILFIISLRVFYVAETKVIERIS